jgi:hypothetical protein
VGKLLRNESKPWSSCPNGVMRPKYRIAAIHRSCGAPNECQRNLLRVRPCHRLRTVRGGAEGVLEETAALACRCITVTPLQYPPALTQVDDLCWIFRTARRVGRARRVEIMQPASTSLRLPPSSNTSRANFRSSISVSHGRSTRFSRD